MKLFKKKIIGTCDTITIETDRLILRKFIKTDAKDIFNNYASDSRVHKYRGNKPDDSLAATKNKLKSWIQAYKSKSRYRWAIVDKDSGQVIGAISFSQQTYTGDDCVEQDSFSSGFAISYDYWGKGLVAEALIATIDYLFNKQGVQLITSSHLDENTSSGRVMIKAGMVYSHSTEWDVPADRLATDSRTLLVYKIEKK